jgi:hypothetical protein
MLACPVLSVFPNLQIQMAVLYRKKPGGDLSFHKWKEIDERLEDR